MATNSILKNVIIRDKILGRRMVSALENASGKKVAPFTREKKRRTLSSVEDIKKVFNDL